MLIVRKFVIQVRLYNELVLKNSVLCFLTLVELISLNKSELNNKVAETVPTIQI
jgi:hypothetical protein